MLNDGTPFPKAPTQQHLQTVVVTKLTVYAELNFSTWIEQPTQRIIGYNSDGEPCFGSGKTLYTANATVYLLNNSAPTEIKYLQYGNATFRKVSRTLESNVTELTLRLQWTGGYRYPLYSYLDVGDDQVVLKWMENATLSSIETVEVTSLVRGR